MKLHIYVLVCTHTYMIHVVYRYIWVYPYIIICTYMHVHDIHVLIHDIHEASHVCSTCHVHMCIYIYVATYNILLVTAGLLIQLIFDAPL
jgi:hypothetical protein